MEREVKLVYVERPTYCPSDGSFVLWLGKIDRVIKSSKSSTTLELNSIIFRNEFDQLQFYFVTEDKIQIGDLIFIKDIGSVKVSDVKDDKIFYTIGNFKKIFEIDRTGCMKIIASQDEVVVGEQHKQELTPTFLQSIIEHDSICKILWEDNQCDGCMAGLDFNDYGVHVKPRQPHVAELPTDSSQMRIIKRIANNSTYGMPYMGCTSERYNKPVLKEGKIVII